MFRRGGGTRCSSPSSHYQTCTHFKPVMRAEDTSPLRPGPTIAATAARGLKPPGLSLNVKHFCPWRALPGTHQGEARAGSRECLHCSRYRALPRGAPLWADLKEKGNSQKGVGVRRAIFSHPLWKCAFSIQCPSEIKLDPAP